MLRALSRTCRLPESDRDRSPGRSTVRFLDGRNSRLAVAAPIELSIICFRYVGGVNTKNDLNRLNSEILRRIVERGNVYLSKATPHKEMIDMGHAAARQKTALAIASTAEAVDMCSYQT
jgi:hypothetical protein